MYNIELTVKKNMLTPKFPALGTSALVIATDPVTRLPMVYTDKAEKGNLAGQVVASVNLDTGAALTNQELTEIFSSNLCDIAFDSVNGNFAKLKMTTKELVKTNTKDDIDAEAQRVIDAGIMTPQELEERITVMMENRCSEHLICRVLRNMKSFDVPVRYPSTIYQDTKPDAKDESIIARCLMAALDRNAVIYEGDKSVGKNVCAETVAWLLGYPYYLVTFDKKKTMGDVAGEKTTKMSQLSQMSAEELVKLRLENPELAQAVVDKGQTIELATEETELITWMKTGGLMMFNEINMAESNFLQSFLNPLADGTGWVYFPGHGRVELSPDCVLTGSQNAGYAGACVQNDATLSRIGCIQFPYPESIEKQLRAATKHLHVDDEVYKQLDGLYQTFFKAVHNGSNAISDKVLNIRGFVRALSSYANGGGDCTLPGVLKTHVGAWAEPQEKSVINTYIDDRITIGTRIETKTAKWVPWSKRKEAEKTPEKAATKKADVPKKSVAEMFGQMSLPDAEGEMERE